MRSGFELDEQIYIALGAEVILQRRAKDCEPPDSVFLEQGSQCTHCFSL